MWFPRCGVKQGGKKTRIVKGEEAQVRKESLKFVHLFPPGKLLSLDSCATVQK